MILLLHHRYRHAGGEERAVADLQWLIREHLDEDVSVLARDSRSVGARDAALGLVGGGLRPGEGSEDVRPAGGPGSSRRRSAGRARASSTPTTCSPPTAGARWPPRALPAPASCCTCTT